MFKKPLPKILLMALVVVSFAQHGIAQEKMTEGVVTTLDSIPVINAEIYVRSTKQTFFTDTLGRFSVPAKQNDRLKVSAAGFFNQKIKLNAQSGFTKVNLDLKPGDENIEYATGYGHISDKDKLNAMVQMNSREVDFSHYNSIYELIKGRFAGVQLINGEVIIRGYNSITSSNAALVVVDGIPVDGSALGSIPPIQVKSINILKDGGSAIYGSRGANGVVIIETKRGH